MKLFNNDFDHATANVPGPIDPSNLDSVDPLFVDPEDGDYRLRPSSPVINKGANAAPKLPAKDIEGNARILLGKVDMGAYEATGQLPRRESRASECRDRSRAHADTDMDGGSGSHLP